MSAETYTQWRNDDERAMANFTLPVDNISLQIQSTVKTLVSNVAALAFNEVAGKRNFVSDLLVINGSATVDTWVKVIDSTGTVLIRGYAAKGGGGFSFTGLRIPVPSAIGASISVQAETTGAEVSVTLSGYVGATQS